MVKLSRNNLLTRNFPRLPPMLGGDTLPKDAKSKEGVIGSQPRGNHNVFTHYPKDSIRKTPSVRCVRKQQQQQHEPGVEKNQRRAWTGCTFYTIRRLDHGRSQNSERGDESRCGHKNDLTVQNDFTNWIQNYPMKTKDTSENNVVFAQNSSSVAEAGKNL